MNSKFKSSLLTLGSALLMIPHPVFADDNNSDKIMLYDAPPHTDYAPEFFLKVNGKDVHVYTSRTAAFASFDFSGKVEVTVTFAGPVYHYELRPLSRNIESELEENRITFTLENPAHLSVEINKNIKRPLFIFANPPEEAIPDRNDKNVLFFEKGKVHTPGRVHVRSGQTVYIEGGAIVRGHFMTYGGKDITIRGRGILDNSRYARREVRPIEINQCENVRVEGIIINEGRHWVLGLFDSENIEVQNLKIVSDNGNDDGIDVVGSRNVLIDNCFIRTKDDCIAIKAGVNYFTDFDSAGNVNNVTVQNSVFWNGMWGNALEIGFETRADRMENIVFRNIDILHVESGGTFTIHNGDRAVVKNVLYEDIRVEDSKDLLIDFAILESRYSKDGQRGFIQDIRFKDISVTGGSLPPSKIHGFNQKHQIENVRIENMTVEGKKVNALSEINMSLRHTEGIRFE